MAVPHKVSMTPITADFFVIRTPQLSLEHWQQIPADMAALSDFLISWYAKHNIREAIYLASPSLVNRLDVLLEKQAPLSQKESLALLKYFIRLCCRPTPFGLFAGIAVGQWAQPTQLQPAALHANQRKTRIDFLYLAGVRQQLTTPDSARQLHIKFFPNPTLWDTGCALHYIEPYVSQGQQQYRLSVVEKDQPLLHMISLAKDGCTLHQLIDNFAADFPTIAPAEISVYLQQLVEQRILQADLALPLTSGQPDLAFIQSLQRARADKEAEVLAQCVAQLAQADQHGQADVSLYQQIFQQLQQLDFPVSENRLFQLDLWRAMQHAQLDPKLITEIEQCLLALKVLTPAPVNEFQQFMQQFNLRFEGQRVPLLQVLDEEIGISFSQETGYDTPLLAGMQIRQATKAASADPLLETALLAAWPSQGQVLQLSSQQLLAQADRAHLMATLPASFAVTLSLYQHKDTALIHWHNCSGPSGANLLGRFCHLDAELTHKVQQHVAMEAALNPDVILAEVVHMPDGRPGNVIARPALRPYEIVFLADSQQPAAHQISVQDLSVFVEDGFVRLWSDRLGQEVVPRLSSAHNYSQRSLGLYRFLCKLQQQHHQTPYFALPQAFHQLPQQPRVQLDHFILREAHWRVERSYFVDLVQAGVWQPAVWQRLEERYQLPRYVCYAVHDNVLTLDLHQAVMVSLLLAETVSYHCVELKEALHMQYESKVQQQDAGITQSFAHEIVIPLLNRAAKPIKASLLPRPVRQQFQITRQFPPGSACLSVKLYAAPSTAELLLQVLAAFAEKSQAQGHCQQWFFIRYNDPKWHLRFRFFGEPKRLGATVLPELSTLLADWLSSQRLHKMEVVSYERELERYGGDQSMALVEQIFAADSRYACAHLALIATEGENLRIRAALYGIDRLLHVFGYQLPDKLALISALRQGFATEFDESAELRQQMGAKFRRYNTLFAADLFAVTADQRTDIHADLTHIRAQFIQQLQPLAQQIYQLSQQQRLCCRLDQVVSALLHMHCNRIFKTYSREQEFVAYDFLRRLYLSQKHTAQDNQCAAIRS